MLINSPTASPRYNIYLTPNFSKPSLSPSLPSSLYVSSPFLPRQLSSNHVYRHSAVKSRKTLRIVSSKDEPLKVMISGAPASGKGTQCEMIAQKFGVVHISTGDILRAEVAASTEIGNKAKEYMNSGRLVPDEIVTAMVTARLSLKDVKEKGWLLDGYPRSSAQAESLEKLNIRPDVYIMLDVPDDVLIDRCVGRRLDPLTGKIYHIKNFPPENEEINERLVTRPDDTEEKNINELQTLSSVIFRLSNGSEKKMIGGIRDTCFTRPAFMSVMAINRSLDTLFMSERIAIALTKLELVKSRLEIYKKNVESILSTYSDLIHKIDGNHPKEVVFKEIDSILSSLQKDKEGESKSVSLARNEDQLDKSASEKNKWRGIPTRLNNIPHSREIRNYFYEDVLLATQRAVKDGKNRLKVEINIPELNPEMDVYRIGTLMELVRNLALSFADDGKRVKVCVQGSMGEGALAGMPLQLAGTRKILEFMDWGDDGAMGTFVNLGSIGGSEVDEQDDIFILVAPQNAVGNCIIGDLRAMTDAAGHRPVILINPKLKDVPGSSGIMQTMGREERLAYAASFELCYFFRLLYYAGTQYPIMGALRMSYPYEYELYKRVNEPPPKKEKYVILSKFEKRPSGEEINDVFEGKTRDKAKRATGIWGFLSSIL